MKRRDFLCSGLWIGASAVFPTVFPNGGLAAIELPSFVPAVSAAEPLMPFWEAAVDGHWHIVKEWLRRDPSLVNAAAAYSDCWHIWHTREDPLRYYFSEKMTLLHVAGAFNPNVGFLKYLVALGADVNAKKGESGQTPLHGAARYNSVEVLKYLVAQGADVNAKNGNVTPLDVADSEEKKRIMRKAMTRP